SGSLFLKNMKYEPAPPPPSSSTASKMMISFFLLFFGASAPSGVSVPLSLAMISRPQQFVGWRGGGYSLGLGDAGQERALVGRQARHDDDLDAAVLRHRPRVARRVQRTGVRVAGRAQPGLRQVVVVDQVPDDAGRAGGGQLPAARVVLRSTRKLVGVPVDLDLVR